MKFIFFNFIRYADYVFRHASKELFNKDIPNDKPLPWVPGRNPDILDLKVFY